jgi:hypothetical protein
VEVTYPSKRDAWIVVLLVVGVAGMVAAAVELWFSPMALIQKSLLVGLSVAGAVLILWILAGTDYTLTRTELRVRCGPFGTRVSLEAIDEITPSRDPLSSPALSLDRLHVKFRGSRTGVRISPRDASGFLLAVAERDAGLEFDGTRVVRTPGAWS